MGPKVRTQSGDSKKLATCGICGKEQRRDNLKSIHFPKQHPGMKYVERGEKKLSFQPIAKPMAEESLLDDTDIEMVQDDNATLATDDGQQVETHKVILGAESPVPPKMLNNFNDVTLASNDGQQNETHKVILGAESPVPPSMLEKLQELEQHMLDIKLSMSKQSTSTLSEEKEDIEDTQILKVKSARDIESLCVIAGLTMYRHQSKLVCDVCDEINDYSNEYKNKGEFKYDFNTHGIDFTNGNQPREFRNLKTHICEHLKSVTHKKMVNTLSEKNKEEEAMEIYNYKAGMKLGRQIYSNVKEKATYSKYERDCAQAAMNKEEIGNINHSKDFAKSITNELGTDLKIEVTKYFSTILECTGQLPPVAFSTDKMTMKRQTGHLAAAITPDVNAPLSGSFMKPVFLGMPRVTKHTGLEISLQMIEILNLFLANVDEQLQSVSNDGQYIHLGIKKHFLELRKGFEDQMNWLLFSWDPAHKLSLGDHDARKNDKDGTKQEGSLSDVLDQVKAMFTHVSYGKHYEEYVSICKELGLTVNNAPLTFSDTRFAQYTFFVLRNCSYAYRALVEQMKAENDIKEGKEKNLRECLEKATSVEFVVSLSGAKDIYRVQQILSQQSQNIDQQIYEVYENINEQLNNLKLLKKGLESDKHPCDWTEDDLEAMDILLLANLKAALKEIITENQFKGVKLQVRMVWV